MGWLLRLLHGVQLQAADDGQSYDLPLLQAEEGVKRSNLWRIGKKLKEH